MDSGVTSDALPRTPSPWPTPALLFTPTQSPG